MKTQKTILVVEDEESLREAIIDVLRVKNFLTLEAKNGREGMKVAFKEHPDLILLDLIMPEMDGMMMLKEVRADGWGAHVPVIILTNLSANSEQLIEDMVTYKPIDYLIKSDWKIHDVVGKIENLFKIKGNL